MALGLLLARCYHDRRLQGIFAARREVGKEHHIGRVVGIFSGLVCGKTHVLPQRVSAEKGMLFDAREGPLMMAAVSPGIYSVQASYQQVSDAIKLRAVAKEDVELRVSTTWLGGACLAHAEGRVEGELVEHLGSLQWSHTTDEGAWVKCGKAMKVGFW